MQEGNGKLFDVGVVIRFLALIGYLVGESGGTVDVVEEWTLSLPVADHRTDVFLVYDRFEGLRIDAFHQVAHFFCLNVELAGPKLNLYVLAVLVGIAELMEAHALALSLALAAFHRLEKAGNHFLDVLALDFAVVLGLLHEKPGEGGGEILEVSLEVSDAVDGGGAEAWGF